MQANAGATAPYVPEEVESDDEIIYEAEEEEHEDAEEMKENIEITINVIYNQVKK